MATYARVVTETSSGNISQNTSGNAATASAVAYSGLTGTVPTWNQSTSGNAATATALSSSGGVSLTGDVTASAVTYTSGGDVALSSSLSDNTVSASKLAGKGAALGNGTAGQFLKSEGNGTFSWQDQASPNNGTITLEGAGGIDRTIGDFSMNQSGNETLTIQLDSGVAGAGLTLSSGVLSVDASQAITGVTGNFTVAGDLTVSGSTITTTTETLEVADNTIVVNSDAKADVDGGFVVNCSGGNNGVFYFDASEDAWMAGIGTATDLTTGVKAFRVATQNVTSSLDTNDTATPIGGMQIAGGVLYVRTA